MASACPAYEFSDDPTVWAVERAAHARRWLAAERIVSALIHAAHSVPKAPQLPTRDSHEAHLRSVQHFAALVRESRALPVWLGGQRVISPALVRAMHSRGVLLTEVEVSV